MPIVLAYADPPAAVAQASLGPITDPQWQTVPTPESALKYYPADALAQDARGIAAVECRVASDGWLVDCKVLAEQPENGPFGQAALKVAAKFRMKPKTLSGVPTVGRTVRVPIAFGLLEDGKDPAQEGMFAVRRATKWVHRATGEDIARVYPKAAAGKLINGKATMHCQIKEDGRLTACETRSEEPAGLGFGEAVLKLAPLFQLDIRNDAGAAMVGKGIDIPVHMETFLGGA